VAEPDAVIWMRPEHAKAGRPAERSRAELTAAAIGIADREGLAAVSMRRVAAELGTGPATLYRYVANRADLLDLMANAVASEYELAAPSGNWTADLVGLGRQARWIMLRHPWLPAVVISAPVIGPRAVDLLEYVLDVLSDHPAGAAAKLEAFAMLMAVTATYVQHELSTTAAAQHRQVAYLQHVAEAGGHPRIAALLTEAATAPDVAHPDQFAALLARVLSGLLPAAPDGSGVSVKSGP
jgi:AcrR family transcriptional regulator